MTDKKKQTATKMLSPFDSPDIKDPLSDNWGAKRKLSDATRLLIENLVTCSTDTETLEKMAAVISEQAELLGESPACRVALLLKRVVIMVTLRI
ncbi:hypothetical protein [Oceanicoccus sp. KOV_DT_Chl]|uniref:hypothetical protein n=1 Tax=Oceanicoccus sp. KOV_DT_Chl TaxID=1904639 RepID=UPI000C7A28FC|nr:hypothetical protein [Oceanicoccus sp. KOV_DT_Chl]